MRKFLTVLCAALFFSTGAFAQEEDEEEEEGGFSINAGTDLSSAYLWRGNLLLKGANFQPYLDLNAGNFTLEFWNCTDFHGDLKEFDISAMFTAGQFTFTLTDYFTQDSTRHTLGTDYNPRYGDYHAATTGHAFEFSVDWESSFGLDASMNFLFYGADKKWWLDESDPDYNKNAYGTYFELGYTADIKGVDFRPCVGMVFNASTWYGDGTGTHDGFNVVNIGIQATKKIKITDKFSLPVYAIFGYNPQADNVAACVGFKIGF